MPPRVLGSTPSVAALFLVERKVRYVWLMARQWCLSSVCDIRAPYALLRQLNFSYTSKPGGDIILEPLSQVDRRAMYLYLYLVSDGNYP